MNESDGAAERMQVRMFTQSGARGDAMRAVLEVGGEEGLMQDLATALSALVDVVAGVAAAMPEKGGACTMHVVVTSDHPEPMVRIGWFTAAERAAHKEHGE